MGNWQCPIIAPPNFRFLNLIILTLFLSKHVYLRFIHWSWKFGRPKIKNRGVHNWPTLMKKCVQNCPLGKYPFGISLNQVEVLCLDRGLGGAILDSDKTAWNISELFFYDLLNIVQQKKIGQKYFASLKKWCKK